MFAKRATKRAVAREYLQRIAMMDKLLIKQYKEVEPPELSPNPLVPTSPY